MAPVCEFCGENYQPLWICKDCGFVNCEACEDELPHREPDREDGSFEPLCPNCHDDNWEELWYDKDNHVWMNGDVMYS